MVVGADADADDDDAYFSPEPYIYFPDTPQSRCTPQLNGGFVSRLQSTPMTTHKTTESVQETINFGHRSIVQYFPGFLLSRSKGHVGIRMSMGPNFYAAVDIT